MCSVAGERCGRLGAAAPSTAQVPAHPVGLALVTIVAERVLVFHQQVVRGDKVLATAPLGLPRVRLPSRPAETVSVASSVLAQETATKASKASVLVRRQVYFILQAVSAQRSAGRNVASTSYVSPQRHPEAKCNWLGATPRRGHHTV